MTTGVDPDTPTAWHLHKPDPAGPPTAAARTYWPPSFRCEVWLRSRRTWAEEHITLDVWLDDLDWMDSTEAEVQAWIIGQ